MNEEHKYIDFESYKRVAEPHKRERASAWRTAIGLQDVDGLRVSEYLKETAVKHIEGDITIEEAKELIDSYYKSADGHKSIENDRTDVQSANSTAELPLKCKNCTLEEAAVLRIVQKNPTVTQKQIAAEIGKSERTVKTITVNLQEKGILQRVNGKRNGRWEITDG